MEKLLLKQMLVIKIEELFISFHLRPYLCKSKAAQIQDGRQNFAKLAIFTTLLTLIALAQN